MTYFCTGIFANAAHDEYACFLGKFMSIHGAKKPRPA
jgi:hypothetical protein